MLREGVLTLVFTTVYILYSKEENQVIQDDFKQWLKSTPIDILNDVLSFHHAHQLHRKKVKTVSVCAVQSKQPGMHYQAF